MGGIKAEYLAAKYDTPLYVYEESVIREKYFNLVDNIPYKKLRIFFALKANSNPYILRLFRKLGAGVETVSLGEVKLALKIGFKPKDILFTCSNIGDDEIKFLARCGVIFNADSLNQLEKWGKIKPGSEVSLRVNPGIGAGGHKYLITAGKGVKFGIYHTDLGKAKRIARSRGLKIVGIHQHIGSSVLDSKVYLRSLKPLLIIAENFGDLRFIDFGGGFGIPYKPGQKSFDFKTFGRGLTELFGNFVKKYGRDLELYFEPGKYLVGEAGVLLAKVMDIKALPYGKFVGINTGFNHFIRPAFYKAYHKIINASRVRGAREVVNIVGNICESGDFFAKERKITKFKEGDVVAILDVGAYGYSMSSEYNLHPRPAEVIVFAKKSKLIRKRSKPY